MRIAILTYSRESNCGAVLQAWALKKAIERLGHVVDMPVVKGFENRGRWYLIMRSAKEGPMGFIKNLIYQCFTIGIKELVDHHFKKAIDKIFKPHTINIETLSNYDVVVIGSDQVWNPGQAYKLPLYLGEEIPHGVPLVGYAVSAGDIIPKEDFDSRYANAIKRFSKVYVREQSTSDLLFRASGIRCEKTLDPSLLLTIEQYAELEEGAVPDEPYVFFYALGTNDVTKIVPDILKAVGVERAVFFDGSFDFVPHKKAKGYKRFISPGEFVRLVRNAVAIVACSFHGTAFALLARKPFVSLTTRAVEKKFDTRPGDLLRRLGCEERMFSVKEPVDGMCAIVSQPIDENIIDRLNDLRQASLNMLGCSLSMVGGCGGEYE